MQYRPNPAGETTDAPTDVYGLFGFDPRAGGHESTHQLNQVVTDPVSDAVGDPSSSCRYNIWQLQCSKSNETQYSENLGMVLAQWIRRLDYSGQH